jgi:Ca-activated chloride channel family protein
VNDKLTFANPEWLLVTLIIIPLVILKAVSAAQSREGLAKVTSPRLRKHLVTARRPLGDWGRFSLQVIGLALLAIAMARPQKGFIEEMTRVEGRNIMLAIDTSRSMLAEDIQKQGSTSRLQAAKLGAIDIIKSLPEDRIGVIAFAGSAMMQAPMTPDHSAVIETIEQLNTFVIERGGTNLAAAIDLARKRLIAEGAVRSALILFTDGDDLEGVALKAAEKAAEDNVVIITIGVGSKTPSIVPDPEPGGGSEFLKDPKGKLVKSSMDPESLEKIAKATNGIFINLSAGSMKPQTLESVLATISYSQSEDRLKRTPRERFFVPLLLGLALVTVGYLATRWGSRPNLKPAIAALLALGLFSATTLPASTESEAYTAYEEGDYEKALDQYLAAAKQQKGRNNQQELAFGSGSAAYQNGDYSAALEAFGDALTSSDPNLQERSHYNVGNTLFRQGEAMWKDQENGGMKQIAEVIRDWEDAADHYRGTLSLNAENADAQTNLEIVEGLIEQLKKLQEQEQEKQDPEEKKEEEKKQEEEEKESDEKKQEEQQKEESEKEESGDPSEEKQEPEDAEKGEENSEPGDDPAEEQEPQDEGDGEESEDREDANPSDDPQGESEGEGEATDQEDESGDAATDAKPADPDPDDEVNEETGYSKNQARENLKKLSDEQRDLGILKRRKYRQKTDRYRDW